MSMRDLMTTLKKLRRLMNDLMLDRGDEDRSNPRAPFNQTDDGGGELEEYVVTVEFFVKSTDHETACEEVEFALNQSNVNDFFELWQSNDVEKI